ncbi:MAG: aminoacyl-tRNA hydrolase [Aquificales bacterium]|nr:aminoacyl-tRNA hydrolase [Aquificales bacterium]
MDKENELIINEKLRISLSELQYRFSTSSGPGGQHANKAATRVTLIYDVANSPTLTEDMRRVLLKRLAPHLDKDGVLQIHAQESRSQHRNREIVNGRFRKLLTASLNAFNANRYSLHTSASKHSSPSNVSANPRHDCTNARCSRPNAIAST